MDQNYGADAAQGPSVIGIIFSLAIFAFIIASMWRVFTKAGHPGWASIVPIYNIYIMTQIAGRPGWWVVLAIIPCVSIIAMFVLSIDIARAFGRGVGFGVGLALLGFIFYPILAFGDATFQGPPQHA
jgi:uncharacterized membrane protein YoaK (UPF0700 family)